jgi:hypothetical protein
MLRTPLSLTSNMSIMPPVRDAWKQESVPRLGYVSKRKRKAA